jgi:glucose dehydrogenase
MSLKDTIANGADNVKKMQEAWNYKQCQKRFMEIVFDND